MHYIYGKAEIIWCVRIYYLECKIVCSLFRGHEYIAVGCGDGASVDSPPVGFAGKGGVQRQFGHARDMIYVIDPEIHGGWFVGASGGRERKQYVYYFFHL